jgi:hypothetical protein
LIFTGFEGFFLFFIAQWTGEGRLDALKLSRRYLVSGQAILEKVRRSKIVFY